MVISGRLIVHAPVQRLERTIATHALVGAVGSWRGFWVAAVELRRRMEGLRVQWAIRKLRCAFRAWRTQTAGAFPDYP